MTQASQRPAEWTSHTAPASRDVRAALAILPPDDLLRLRAIARLRARALPGGMSWSDLLHEAVVRALAGTRPWPPDVPLLAFLAGVMRSLCDEQWRRHHLLDRLPPVHDSANPTDGPERAYAATQAVAAIHRLFATDAAATMVITGLSGGMTPEEIRRHYGLSVVEYDTARRRMRRTMLRHGLGWSWP